MLRGQLQRNLCVQHFDIAPSPLPGVRRRRAAVLRREQLHHVRIRVQHFSIPASPLPGMRRRSGAALLLQRHKRGIRQLQRRSLPPVQRHRLAEGLLY